MLTLIWKHAIQPVCLKLILTMPRSVILIISNLILKYVACVFVGSSSAVDIVILGTNWCWHAGTDKEFHLSY